MKQCLKVSSQDRDDVDHTAFVATLQLLPTTQRVSSITGFPDPDLFGVFDLSKTT
jgi:hypothetical protein